MANLISAVLEVQFSEFCNWRKVCAKVWVKTLKGTGKATLWDQKKEI